MKTIKQIADQIGVSKQAVRDKIAKLELQSKVYVSGKFHFLADEEEALIIQAFTDKSPSKTDKQPTSKPQTTLQFTLRLLEQEIEFLRGQLKAKDEQLERLDRRLAEAQILHADTKKMPLLPKADSGDSEENRQQEGFLQKIFGRKRH